MQKLGFSAKFKVQFLPNSFPYPTLFFVSFVCTKCIPRYILQDFKIQNIVGSCDVKFPIRLEGLAYSHAAFSSVSDLNS